MKNFKLFLVLTSLISTSFSFANRDSGLQNSAFVILRNPELSQQSVITYSPEIKSRISKLAAQEGGQEKFLNDYLKLLNVALHHEYFQQSQVNTQSGRLSLPIDFAAENLSDQKWNEFSKNLINELADLDRNSKYVQEFIKAISFGWGNFQIYFNFAGAMHSPDQREKFFNRFQGRQLQLLSLLYLSGLVGELNSQISRRIQLELSTLKQARESHLKFDHAHRMPHEVMFGGQLSEVLSAAAALVNARTIYLCQFIF